MQLAASQLRGDCQSREEVYRSKARTEARPASKMSVSSVLSLERIRVVSCPESVLWALTSMSCTSAAQHCLTCLVTANMHSSVHVMACQVALQPVLMLLPEAVSGVMSWFRKPRITRLSVFTTMQLQ